MTPFEGLVRLAAEPRPGFAVDWLGGLTAANWLGINDGNEANWTGWGAPGVDEEYWEWVDIVAAVRAAGQHFVMFELGAGWGRWCVRAAHVIRQLRSGLPAAFTAIEAEPTHFTYLVRHFSDNGLDPYAHRLAQCAVDGDSGLVSFASGHANEWWGQAIVAPETDLPAHGWRDGRVIWTPAVTLSSLLRGVGQVDLIDMDVQGAELAVVSEAIIPLTAQVKRLHIGTHGDAIENGLQSVLSRAGWQMITAYGCAGKRNTTIGEVTFVDGVQSWVNPALV